MNDCNGVKIDISKFVVLNDLIEFLNKNSDMKRICIQITKKYIHIASSLKFSLEEHFPTRFFIILGESIYGECCIDEITANHLNPDLIVKVGNSCYTLGKSVQSFYLPIISENFSNQLIFFEKLLLEKSYYEEISNKFRNLTKSDVNIFILYDNELEYTFNEIRMKFLNSIDKNNDFIFPVSPNEHQLNENVISIFNRHYVVLKNEVDEKNYKSISKSNVIFYLYDENSKNSNEVILYELAMSNELKSLDNSLNNYLVYTCGYNKLKADDLNTSNIDSFIQPIKDINTNLMITKKFNLSQKALNSKTFGIIVGSANIKEITDIINCLKVILKKNGKKYYTFLLGKPTEDKLATFTEYIDCFIMISCLYSSFKDNKVIDKPVASPIDILHAFGIKAWDANYSFDCRKIMKFMEKTDNTEFNYKNNEYLIEEKIKLQDQALVSLKNDEDKSLSLIFSNTIYDRYNKRCFKGIEINKNSSNNSKILIGKKGIPIQYEDIKIENENILFSNNENCGKKS